MVRPTARLGRILHSSLESSSSLANSRPRPVDNALAFEAVADGLAVSAQADGFQLWELGGEVARLVDGPNPWSAKQSKQDKKELRRRTSDHLLHANAMGLQLGRYQSKPPSGIRPSPVPILDCLSTSSSHDLPPHLSPSLWPSISPISATQGTSARRSRPAMRLSGEFSRQSLRAQRGRLLKKALQRAVSPAASSEPGSLIADSLTEYEVELVRTLYDEGLLDLTIDGSVLADLIKLRTLDDELESVSPIATAEAADPVEVCEHRALLGLFLDRYVALPTFVAGIRQATLRRLFGLGLEPTLALAEELLSAVFDRRLTSTAIVKEARGILSQLQFYGIGIAPIERKILLEAALRGHRHGQFATSAAASHEILSIERELDLLSRGESLQATPS